MFPLEGHWVKRQMSKCADPAFNIWTYTADSGKQILCLRKMCLVLLLTKNVFGIILSDLLEFEQPLYRLVAKWREIPFPFLVKVKKFYFSLH